MSGNRIYVIDGLSKGPIDGVDKDRIINIGNTNKSGTPTLSQVLHSGNLADLSIRWQNSVISPFVYAGNDVLSTYQELNGNGSGIVFHTNYFDLYSKKTVEVDGVKNTYNSFLYSKQTGSTVLGLSDITSDSKKDVVIDLNKEFGILVVDEINKRGLVGFEYFGDNYEDNSYIQKFYVDEQIKKTTISDWSEDIIYDKGVVVSHNGGIWRSNIDENQSEPSKICGPVGWELAEGIFQLFPHPDPNFEYEAGMFLYDNTLQLTPKQLVKLSTGFVSGEFEGDLSDVMSEHGDGGNYILLNNNNYLDQDCELILNDNDGVYLVYNDGINLDEKIYKLISCPFGVFDQCNWELLAEVNEEFIETQGIDEVLANGDLAINKNFLSQLSVDDPQVITPFAVYYKLSDVVNSTTQTKGGQYVVQKESNGYINVYNGLPSKSSSANITSITYFGYRSAYGFTLDDMPGNPTSWFGLYAGAFAGFSIKGNNNNFVGARAGRNLVNVTNTTLIGSYIGTSSDSFDKNIIISDGTTAQTGIGFRVLEDGTTTTPRQSLTTYNNDSTNKAVVTKEILNSVISGLDVGSFATQMWVSGNFINKTEKGSANGVATLDSNGKIVITQLPSIAISETFVVDSEANQIALTVQIGDVAVRTDIKKSFIHNGGSAGDISDWTELLTPTDSVLSVNGMTGAVSIGFIGLDDTPNSYTGSNNKFVSVNSSGNGIEFRGISGDDLNMGTGSAVYVPSMVPNSGTWERLVVSNTNNNTSLVLRTSTGTVRTSTATHENDAVTLGQLNSAIESNKITWDSEEW